MQVASCKHYTKWLVERSCFLTPWQTHWAWVEKFYCYLWLWYFCSGNLLVGATLPLAECCLTYIELCCYWPLKSLQSGICIQMFFGLNTIGLYSNIFCSNMTKIYVTLCSSSLLAALGHSFGHLPLTIPSSQWHCIYWKGVMAYQYHDISQDLLITQDLLINGSECKNHMLLINVI